MDTQPMSVRFRPDLHERLRRVAFDRRESMNEIVNDAVEAWLRILEVRGKEVHHKDGDPRNNDPSNLEIRESER